MNKEGRWSHLPEIRKHFYHILRIIYMQQKMYQNMKLHLLHLLPLYHKFPWQFGEVDKFRQRERNKRVSNR